MTQLISGITAKGLKVVVDFAYKGTLQVTVDNVEEVLSAATYLQINDAVKLCSQYFETSINFENCVDIFSLADMYSLSSTYRVAKDFMLSNFKIVAKSSQYRNLTHTQLRTLLDENSLMVTSEYRLFKLVLSWVNQNPSQRNQLAAGLIEHIRLPLLTGKELVQKVSKVPLMMENQQCNNLLTEAKDYHILVSQQPVLQTIRTQVRSDVKCLVMCHRENLEYYNIKNQHHGYLTDNYVQLYYPSVAVVDNFMYACGGKYDHSENNDIATARCFRYDPRFDSWYELPSMNEARKHFALLPFYGQLYAIAGLDENMVLCTMEVFNIAAHEWEYKSPLPHSVYGHAGAVCDGTLYISGGQKVEGCCNDMVRYDPVRDIWEMCSPMAHPRLNHNMVTQCSKIYVMRGNIEDHFGFPVPVTDIECYIPEVDQWTSCQTELDIREAGACLYDDKIYIVGGINGEHDFSNLIQSYSPVTEELHIIKNYETTRLYGRACCILTLPQYV